MVFVSIALLLAIGWIALRSGDEYAIARQKQLLGNAFEAAADQVAGEVSPQVFWQDAYEHVRNRDIPWIDANLGKYMTGLFGYDHLFVVDSADRPIYSLQHGKEDIGLAHYRAMQPAIAQSLADVRNALTAPAGGQGSDNAASLSMKMLSDGTRLPLVIVGNLESIMGRPSAIVAATIVPDLDSRSFSGKPDVLVATRELNGAFLKSVASRFGFQDLRWGADNGGGRVSYDLTSKAGHFVGTLSWQPDRPTAAFLRKIAPALAVALLVLLLAAAVAVSFTRRFMAAESRDRAKRTFLAIMSHEIRTPLNGIAGMAELMDTPDLSPNQRAKLTVIRDCSDALLDLINDILDFSKLEAGQSEIEIRAFALGEVVETVMDIVAAGARQKGLCLMAAYPSLTIATDPTRLRQVMLNLIGNAVKFTDAGDVLVRISEAPAKSGRAWLRFEIRDSGVGISPAALPRLFREFTQVDTSISRRFGGTGLGLAICSRLVEALGGGIGVESEPGKGSTFWFTLPVGPATSEIRPPVPPRARIALASPSEVVNVDLCAALIDAGYAAEVFSLAAPRPDLTLVDVRCLDGGPRGFPGDLGGAAVFGFGATAYAGKAGHVIDGPLTMNKIARAVAGAPGVAVDTAVIVHRDGHVLVVEDNAVNREVAAGLLARKGLTVEVACNGREAVERVAAVPFDLVFMDMQMPVMDGLEATRRIRGLPKPAATVPIVGLTANAFLSDRQACLDAGMNGFIAKPIKSAKLDAILDEFLPAPAAAPARAIASAGPVDGVFSEAALIDFGQQASLLAELGEETFRALADSFWRDTDTIFAEIENPLSAVAAIDRALHTLKGSAATFGFSGIARLAATVSAEFRATGALQLSALRAIVAASRRLKPAPAAETGRAARAPGASVGPRDIRL